ncbi:MAG: histidine kinase [Dictyoglomus sp.]
MSEIKTYEIEKGLYLFKDPEPFFNFNSYLLTCSMDDKVSINILFDPLPLKYFKDFIKTLNELVGVENIDIIYTNHQDPDLTSSVPALLDLAPRAIYITSQDTWRLVSGYNIDPKKFQPVEFIPNRKLKLNKEGDMCLEFIPTPFCHFRGATAVYYPKLKALFSGDLLGGASTKDTEGIYATEKSWLGIKLFHEMYMPTKEALKLAVDKIGRLNPLPELILPQHGDIIKGSLIIKFLSRLNDLEVGLDYIHTKEKEEEFYIRVLNDMLDFAKKKYGEENVYNKLNRISTQTSNFPEIVKIENGVISEVYIPAPTAFVFVYDAFCEDLPESEKEELRLKSIETFKKYNLEVPEELLYKKSTSIMDTFRRVFDIFRR